MVDYEPIITRKEAYLLKRELCPFLPAKKRSFERVKRTFDRILGMNVNVRAYDGKDLRLPGNQALRLIPIDPDRYWVYVL